MSIAKYNLENQKFFVSQKKRNYDKHQDHVQDCLSYGAPPAELSEPEDDMRSFGSSFKRQGSMKGRCGTSHKNLSKYNLMRHPEQASPPKILRVTKEWGDQQPRRTNVESTNEYQPKTRRMYQQENQTTIQPGFCPRSDTPDSMQDLFLVKKGKRQRN